MERPKTFRMDPLAASIMVNKGITPDKSDLDRLVLEMMPKLQLVAMAMERDYQDNEFAREIRQVAHGFRLWHDVEVTEKA